MTEAELRARIRDVLCSLNVTAEAALRRELAEPIDLGHSERLQFEAGAHSHSFAIYTAIMVAFFCISFPLTRLAIFLERRLV